MFDWIAAGFELSGNWIVGNKKKFGFLLLIICNVLWVVVAIKMKVYGLLLVVVPAFGINVRNFLKWRKRNNKDEA